MTFQLTDSQQRAVDECSTNPVRVVDARNISTYVLVTEKEYQRLRDLLDEEATQAEIHAMAKRNALAKIIEAP